jgi:hypothetical protein
LRWRVSGKDVVKKADRDRKQGRERLNTRAGEPEEGIRNKVSEPGSSITVFKPFLISYLI